MQKRTLFLMQAAVLALSLAITGCHKKQPAAGYTATQPSPVEKIPISAPTPGALHNRAVTIYINRYGLGTTAMDYTRYCEATRRMTLVMIDDNILDADTDPDSFTQTMINLDLEAGIIKADLSLATPEEFYYISRSIGTNTAIRDALNNLYYYTGSPGNYIPYAQAQIKTLAGLTAQQQKGVDGLGSVLAASYVVWDGKLTSEQKAKIVWDADALGFWTYKVLLESKGWPSQVAESIAAYQAAKVSIEAYEFVKNK
jgi:hypothetical protein